MFPMTAAGQAVGNQAYRGGTHDCGTGFDHFVSPTVAVVRGGASHAE